MHIQMEGHANGRKVLEHPVSKPIYHILRLLN